MKSTMHAALLAVSLLLLNATTHAQSKAQTDHGNWQLVSRNCSPSKLTVQFFSNDGSLMYEETLYNVKLNIERRKTVRRLNEVLKQVHETWVKNKIPLNQRDIIAKMLK